MSRTTYGMRFPGLLQFLVSFAIVLAIALPLGYVGASVGENRRAEQMAIADIPPGATDVVDLGNNWRVFNLKDGGRTRRFLHHFIVNHHEAGRAIHETIVELRD